MEVHPYIFLFAFFLMKKYSLESCVDITMALTMMCKEVEERTE